MSKIWELQPKMNAKGYADFQPCEVTITSVKPEIKGYKSGGYQSATAMNSSGGSFPVSLFYPTGQAQTPPELNQLLNTYVRVEADTSKHAVNGLKYTVKIMAGKAEGSASTGFKGHRHEEDPVERKIMILTRYAVDLCIADKIKSEEIVTFTLDLYNQVDAMVKGIKDSQGKTESLPI